MKFTIKRENLLKPLKKISNITKNNTTFPILNNILLKVINDYLLLITTNLEIEIITRVKIDKIYKQGSITVSSRKFFDICYQLPENIEIIVTLKNQRLLIYSNNSYYSLNTLPVSNFPNINNWESNIKFNLTNIELKKLIEFTQFSMANNDIRCYLNGMLFEIENNELRTVTTDGYRLSMCKILIKAIKTKYKVIIPRKSILELLKMLDNNKDPILIKIGISNIKLKINDYIFTSKLINSNFPDYRHFLTKNINQIFNINSNILRDAFSRISILSDKKINYVKLLISKNKLKISINNSEKEVAEEIIDIKYQGTNIEVNFNVKYLLDVLNLLKNKQISLSLTSSTSALQIEEYMNKNAVYIIMPIRI